MNNEPANFQGSGHGPMRVFECQARLRDMPDQRKTVTIEASSEEEAIQKAVAQGYMVISIRDTGGRQRPEGRRSFFSFSFAAMGAGGKASKPLFPSLQRVTTRELIFFAIQLSTLLKAGVPLLRSLEIIRKGMKNQRFNEILGKIAARISSGMAFGTAIGEHKNVFPWVWCNLVEVGEATGKLPECLEEVAQYQESAARIQRKVLTAFFYPGILSVAVIAALTFLLLFVVPKFADIFAKQNMTLPLITQIVLGVSNFIREKAYLIPVALLPFVLLWIYIRKVPKARIAFDSFSLSAPIFGPLLLQVAVVRFSRGFGTLLKAGIQILQALDIGGRLTENKYLETVINDVAKAVKGGQGLGTQLEARKVFPVFMTQLVSVGEETGQIDKFLKVIADFYEEQVDAFLTRLSTMIEPVLLLVMGAVIGTVVISMFLPIVELSTRGGMS